LAEAEALAANPDEWIDVDDLLKNGMSGMRWWYEAHCIKTGKG